MWMEYDGQLEKNMESSPVNAMQVFNVVKQLEKSDIWGILHKYMMLQRMAIAIQGFSFWFNYAEHMAFNFEHESTIKL